MPEDTAAINAKILERLNSIDRHLAQMNGRISKNEERSLQNDKNIAIITTRCQYLTHEQDGTIQRIEKDQQRIEDKVISFLKSNGVQVGEIGTLLFLVGKVSGWW